MPTAEELHTQSEGFHDWSETTVADRAKWIKWAQRCSNAPEVALPSLMYSNFHALIQVGFNLGNSMVVLCDPSMIPQDWGGPIQQNFGGLMPVRLNAPVHQFTEPEFDEDGFSLVLSFDRLRRCKIPWEAIQQVIFIYDEPEPEPKMA